MYMFVQYMYMKVHEFRKQLSQAFDAALDGQDVLIEHGNIIYRLSAERPGRLASNAAMDAFMNRRLQTNGEHVLERHPTQANPSSHTYMEPTVTPPEDVA